MDDRGYVRTYTSRKVHRRRRKRNNGAIALVVVLCLIAAGVAITLIVKTSRNSGSDPGQTTTTAPTGVTTTAPENTSGTSGTSGTSDTSDTSETSGTTGEQEETTTEPDTTEPVTTEPVTNEVTDKIENGALKIKVDESNWMLALVNKYYTVGRDYTPPELVKLPGSDGAGGGNNKLDARAAVYFEQMYAKCLEDTGVVLNTVSAYRTYDFQDGLYTRQVDREISRGLDGEAAELKAATVVARPGTSDHNLGLGIDIGRVTSDFENSKGYRWLDEHAHEYGFVLRYPKNKQGVTHVIYEPWHWRFVGVDAAKVMKEKGLTLEEYLGLVDEPAELRRAIDAPAEDYE